MSTFLYPTSEPYFYHERKNFPTLWTRRISITGIVRKHCSKQTCFGRGVSMSRNIVWILIRLKHAVNVMLQIHWLWHSSKARLASCFSSVWSFRIRPRSSSWTIRSRSSMSTPKLSPMLRSNPWCNILIWSEAEIFRRLFTI